MKNLKNKTKRVLSLGLALLMVVSTMFVGGIQAKADTGTTYEPYYDEETGGIVGGPEVGTVITAGDIIKAGDKITDDTYVDIRIYALEEECVEDADGYGNKQLSKGEEVDVATLRSRLCENKNGFKVEAISFEDYEVFNFLVIELLSLDEPTKLENIEIELDWSKVEAEIGGTLSPESFTNGFIKNEEIVDTSASLFECIYITKPDGTMEYDETCTINADDSYRFELVYYVADGYYFSAEGNDIALEDSLVDSVFHWGYSSNVWDDQVSLVFEFTGAELVEKVENANNSSTPEVPPTEEVEKLELMPNAQAGPQNMKHGLSVKTFQNAII